jgi:hypothetical protein
MRVISRVGLSLLPGYLLGYLRRSVVTVHVVYLSVQYEKILIVHLASETAQ